MDSVNMIQCPYCKVLIEPWNYIETGDMEGDFTLQCENETCGKEFNVSFATDIRFNTSTI